jgi:hypothetical protein
MYRMREREGREKVAYRIRNEGMAGGKKWSDTVAFVFSLLGRLPALPGDEGRKKGRKEERKKGEKEGRKEGRKEGGKEGRKEGGKGKKEKKEKKKKKERRKEKNREF